MDGKGPTYKALEVARRCAGAARKDDGAATFADRIGLRRLSASVAPKPPGRAAGVLGGLPREVPGDLRGVQRRRLLAPRVRLAALRVSHRPRADER